MTHRKPYFSIIMPTRNRAHVLPYAIKSVLQQDFEDFEIILSDNFSEDDTKEIVEGFNDERIRYFRTSEFLPIDESWNYAISKASGEFFTFLADDDAYLNFRLRKANEIISKTGTKLLVHKYAGYYPQGNSFQGKGSLEIEKNSLSVPWFSAEFLEVEARETLNRVFSEIEHYASHPVAAPIYFADMPHVSDAFYHYSLFESISKKVPKFLHSRQGDIYLGVNVLNEIDTYIYLDSPLTVFSTYPEQTTSIITAAGLQGNIEKVEGETSFKRVPLKFWTETNALADILLEALEDNNTLGDKYDLNWTNYFSKCWRELDRMEKVGINVSEFRKVFAIISRDYMERGLVTKLDHRSLVASKRKLKEKVWSRVQTLQISKIARMRLDESVNARYWRKLLISGEKAGLNSVLDCVTLLDEDFINRSGEFWRRKKALPVKFAKLV